MLESTKRIFHTRKIYLVNGLQREQTDLLAENIATRIHEATGHALGAYNREEAKKAYAPSYFGRQSEFLDAIRQDLNHNDERPIVVSNPGSRRTLKRTLQSLASKHGIEVEYINARTLDSQTPVYVHGMQLAKKIIEGTSVAPLNNEEIHQLFEEAGMEGLPERALHHILKFIHERFHFTSSSFMLRQRPLEQELRERLQRAEPRLYNNVYFHSIIEDQPKHLTQEQHQEMLRQQRRVSVDLAEGPRSKRLTARVLTGHEHGVDEEGHYFNPAYHETQHHPVIDARLGRPIRSVFIAPLFEVPASTAKSLPVKYVPPGKMAMFRVDATRRIPQQVISEIKRIVAYGRHKIRGEVTTQLDRTLQELWKNNIINTERHEALVEEIHDLEAEDEYTAGHTLRVASLVQLFGRYAHRELSEMMKRKRRELARRGETRLDVWPEEYLDAHARRFFSVWGREQPFELFDRLGIIQLYHAGLLHDIGKRRKGIPEEMQVPLQVLQKPGQLHYDERSMMRRHPLAAAFALKDFPLDHPILLAATQHHASWNGKGSYPYWYDAKTKRLRLLKGPQIHPYAQFVALADVFDALVSKRPYPKKVNGTYRDQYSVERTAHEILTKMKGKFSPFVLRVFKRVLRHETNRRRMGLEAIQEIYHHSEMKPGLKMLFGDEVEAPKPEEEPEKPLSKEEKNRLRNEERVLHKRAWLELIKLKRTAKLAASRGVAS